MANKERNKPNNFCESIKLFPIKAITAGIIRSGKVVILEKKNQIIADKGTKPYEYNKRKKSECGYT